MGVVQYTRTDTTGIGSCFSSHDPYDPYDSYYSYGSWNNGSRVVQLVNCISLGRLKVYTEVHDPYDSYYSYGSWNNGSRVVQLVNYISLGRLRPVRLVRLVRVVKQWFTSQLIGKLYIIRETEVHVNCISLGRLRVCTEFHDPYDSYRSWNNGSRVVHLVNCISLRRLRQYWSIEVLKYWYWVMFFFARPVRPVRLVLFVRVVKQWFTSRSLGELCIIREAYLFIYLFFLFIYLPHPKYNENNNVSSGGTKFKISREQVAYLHFVLSWRRARAD